MQIRIKETNETKEWSLCSIVHGQQQCCYVADLIGDDDNIAYDDEIECYVCDQEVYDWWTKVINDHQALEYRLDELRCEHGSEAVWAVLENAPCDEIEYYSAVVNEALDVEFGAK